LHREGNFGHAEDLYREIITAQPNHFDALHLLGLLRYQQGLFAEARNYIAAALKAKGTDVGAWSNFGLVHAQLGNLVEALASYDKALALDPDHVEALINRGIVLRDLKRPADALTSYDRVLALKPDYVQALNNRGNVLRDLNRPADALASYDKALAIQPDYADAHYNRGLALTDLKRPADALASYDSALALKPDYADALNNRGNVLRDLKRPADALTSYDRALALMPNYADALNNRGIALAELKRHADALASYDRALALKPDYAEALNNRGNALTDLQRPADALVDYEKALALKPDYVEAYDNKGIILSELGQFDDAIDAIETAIDLAPRRARSYYNLALIKPMTLGDRHLRAMEELAQDMPMLAADEQIDLYFALSKAFADIGNHERSFRHSLDGNAVKRNQTIYDEAATLAIMERTRAVFTEELLRGREGEGEPSCVPVFIIGMPRSGSTLVEQILASHPQVFGAGEIDDFDQTIIAFSDAAGGSLHSPEGVSSLSAEQLRQLGASYVDRIRSAAPAAARIINKTPENFRFAGLIRLVLPNARIIHTRRDPLDTCLSCFSRLFVGNNLAYVYDLEELGRYYRAYEALMAHWRGVLPQSVMLDVQYEDVVADLEGEARRIVAHCGLEWDARCLDFHQTERPVRTASVTQVRQPIFRSSIGRARRHAGQLRPLFEALDLDLQSMSCEAPNSANEAA
jgi:tetratricopeptide (TPR) repeat protein